MPRMQGRPPHWAGLKVIRSRYLMRNPLGSAAKSSQKRSQAWLVQTPTRNIDHRLMKLLGRLRHGHAVTFQKHQCSSHPGAFVAVNEGLSLRQVECVSSRDI